MNWSPRLPASLSVRLSRLLRSRETLISPAGPFDFGQPPDRLLERGLQPGHGDARAGQQRRSAAVFLREQRRQQMLRLDEAGVVAERETLRVGERLLEFGGQLVESHLRIPGRSIVITPANGEFSSLSTKNDPADPSRAAGR